MNWDRKVKFPNFGRRYRNHHKLVVYRYYVVYFINASKQLDDILPDLRKTLITDSFEPDVEFQVREETFPAHKSVLRITNQEFYIKYVEPHKDQRVIKVDGIDPKGFQQFLRFCHVGDLNLNLLNAMPTYDVAVAFNHSTISSLCCRFISENVQVCNVLEILDWNLRQPNYQILRSCRGFLIENAIDVLKTTDQFVKISRKLLKTILTYDVINCSEKLLFDVTIRWGEAQCVLKKVEPKTLNVRDELEDILYLIRLDISHDLEVLDDFPTNSRINRFSKRKFDNLCIETNLEQTWEVIEATDSNVICHGFSVILSNPDSLNDSPEHFLITLETPDDLLFQKEFKIKAVDYLAIKDFVFERPVTLERHKRHFLKVKFVDSHRSRYIEKDESSTDARERIVRLYD